MRNLSLAILSLLSLSLTVSASGLKLSKPILYLENNTAYTVLNISWDHAWKNGKNHDGVWLFFKSLPKTGGYHHIRVEKEGHAVISVFSQKDVDLDFQIPDDQTGLFIAPANTFRGDIEISVRIMLQYSSFENINVRKAAFNAYGIEMVHVPGGSFKVGSTDEQSLNYGSFYKPDKRGKASGWVEIASEDQELEVSQTGDLFYRANEGYEGDQTGTISSTFPKGFAPFYIMKYEPTEGQYTDFLNSLTAAQASDRIIFNEKNYYESGGTIAEKDGRYASRFPDKPCAFMSWDDAMAYADWAGLRPMTEFEYTKACRGPSAPVTGEYPWGTVSKDKIQRLPNADGQLVMINGWDESKLTDENKKYFGASWYWVMDLSGSMWERLVTIGHPNGRNFDGTHGDGAISPEGYANTQNWPVGQEDSGGIGYRGGGFYGYDREYHEFNPFSPVAYRPYGGWHGSGRTVSYGTRFVRSGY